MPSSLSKLVLGLATVASAAVAAASVAAREPLRAFVDYFIDVVDTLGPAG